MNITRHKYIDIFDYYKNKSQIANFISKVYFQISSSLLLSSATAIITSSSSKLIYITSNIRIILLILPVCIIYYINRNINTMSTLKLKTLFIIFSLLTGISMSYIFIIFTGESIAHIFVITGFISLIISLCKVKDTSNEICVRGSIAIIAITIVFAGLINILLQSSIIHLINSIMGIIVFIMFIIYDIGEIKKIFCKTKGLDRKKLEIYSAILICTNLIGLITNITQILGVRKNQEEI